MKTMCRRNREAVVRILQVRFKSELTGRRMANHLMPFSRLTIFAITGPTGGEDYDPRCCCLALYGRTPRLNKVTKSGNEIMSRQTGECFAGD